MCGFGSDWLKEAAHNPAELPAASALPQGRALLIFVKNPVLGKVKTRLARTMGDAAALAAYRLMLDHARAVALQVEARRIVCYADFIDEADAWSPPAFERALQVHGDIGQRMQAALAAALAAGHARAVLVGSDLLDLQPQHLEQAFRALDSHDFVLGPAADGGYYLVGMKTVEPSIFQDKNWSTGDVLSSTLEDIRRLSATVHLLPELSDIDDEADWVAARKRWEIRQRI